MKVNGKYIIQHSHKISNLRYSDIPMAISHDGREAIIGLEKEDNYSGICINL